ncbi:hypothetical protein FKM82_009639 [Ascaphus truei]
MSFESRVLGRGVRGESMRSMESVSSDMLGGTMTTCNCEMALLPFKLLIELQPEFLHLEAGTLTVSNHNGGYNLFSDSTAHIDGQLCQVINYIQRKVDLTSHLDYKDYRENLLNKPMLFFINAKKQNMESATEKTFAFIVNTRHPKIRAQVEGALNNIISSVIGENYKLQFDFQKVVHDFLLREHFETTGEGLNFNFSFKLDVFFDVFHLLGLSKKTCCMDGKILNLFCSSSAKKVKVALFLSKMSNPYIRIGSNSDRKFSTFSLGIIDEDIFVDPKEPSEETSPTSTLAS